MQHEWSFLGYLATLFFRSGWVVWDALHITKMFIEMLNSLVDFFLIFSVSLQHLGNYSVLLLVF